MYICNPKRSDGNIRAVLKCYGDLSSGTGVRDVAQPGSALAWGARGRKFESCRPDLKIKRLYIKYGLFFI